MSDTRTNRELHVAVHHGRGGACDCPPGWPADLSPGACYPCYKAAGIDRPREQCREHAVPVATAEKPDLGAFA